MRLTPPQKLKLTRLLKKMYGEAIADDVREYTSKKIVARWRESVFDTVVNFMIDNQLPISSRSVIGRYVGDWIYQACWRSVDRFS